MFLNVAVLSTRKIIFEGKASSIILPGEGGVFEIIPYHKNIVSRLISGTLCVDDKVFPLKRGIAKLDRNKATIIIETE